MSAGTPLELRVHHEPHATAFRLAALSQAVARVNDLAGTVDVFAVLPDHEAAFKE